MSHSHIQLTEKMAKKSKTPNRNKPKPQNNKKPTQLLTRDGSDFSNNGKMMTSTRPPKSANRNS